MTRDHFKSCFFKKIGFAKAFQGKHSANNMCSGSDFCASDDFNIIKQKSLDVCCVL